MGKLEDWVDGLVALLPYFKDSHWPEDVPYDFSRASLERLEALALQRYAGLEALGEALGEGEDRDGFLEGVLAYLGEAMRRLGAGSWRWDENKQPGISEQPVVLLDERLGLPAMASVSPYFLLIEAIKKRGGGTFARAYSELQGVVDAHRAEEPEWTPVQQPTPGLDESDPEPADASSVVPEGSSGSGDVVPKAEHWVHAVDRSYKG